MKSRTAHFKIELPADFQIESETRYKVLRFKTESRFDFARRSLAAGTSDNKHLAETITAEDD